MKATDESSEAQNGPGHTSGTAVKVGPSGERLRLRWALSGYRAPAMGNAQFETAYLPDDGTPDDAVQHEWHVDSGLPTYLSVTGWTYKACHVEYERLWAERKAQQNQR
ncbi:hypothetical protein [Kitasatospora sp. NPDC059817]|uniref:hypothetical protein n=1 Tax=Kitasatospora sp. NPDC059817 TaxID=3346961 RepID=UPI00365608AB